MLNRFTLKNELSITDETKGMIFGFIGIFCFSLTLPMTKIALQHLDSGFVIFGRAFFASIAALIILLITKQKLPDKKYLKSLIIVASGVVLGFPLFSSLALKQVDASHGGIIIALLPLVTSIVAKYRTKEKQSNSFWIGSLIGSLTIIIFSLSNGTGFKLADIYLIIGVIICGFGYAEGGTLAKYLGSWQVICWALVITLPITSIKVIPDIIHGSLTNSVSSWSAFLYISFISQLLGFFAWNHGMRLAGISKVSQLQLVQPMLTIVFSSILLGEIISPLAILTLMIVLSSIIISRKSKEINHGIRR